jgi:hypothetical protein
LYVNIYLHVVLVDGGVMRTECCSCVFSAETSANAMQHGQQQQQQQQQQRLAAGL